MQTPLQQPRHPGHVRSVLVKGCCLLAILIAMGIYVSCHDQAETAPLALDKNAAKKPVILLTGFEPFGQFKLPNPSWEGIKELDGQTWKGYQLVCQEMPCVWGAPVENLQKWIAQHQPVAIFSFGQGGPGTFALESRASNERGKSPDNRGQKAPTRTIVSDGPKRFQASIHCAKMARLMAEKGHPIHVSTDAGQYLCEENLYSLEYLKASKQLAATVLFCHVPAYDAQICGQQFTAAYGKEFVLDLLETWHTLYQKEEQTGFAQERGDDPKAKEPRQQDIKDIEKFITRYFSTWSNQDMKGYDGCFWPDACIQHIDAESRISTTLRQKFIAEQREQHRRSPHKMTEVAESIDVRFEAKLARVIVYWKLTAGPRTERGYDHFTLLKVDGNWRIVNLVFYAAAKRIAD